MPRFLPLSLISLMTLLGPSTAQDRPQKAKLESYDADKSVVVLMVDGKKREFVLTDRTRLMVGTMKEIPATERKTALVAGAEVMFLSRKQDGKDVLVGLRIQEAPRKVDTRKLRPLTELGAGKYNGFVGGLYPDGKNERPTTHEKAGRALAAKIEPLDADGKPSKDGKIVLLAVGMSNTSQAASAFVTLANAEGQKDLRVVIVNGAQGGMTAARIQDPDGPGGKTYWTTSDQRLRAARVTPFQVQVVWIKQADASPTTGFPVYAKTLQAELTNIVRLLPKRYPNVKLVYLSSRTYGGYATTALNPEPYAYESGFAVKWLLEDQFNGKLQAPWLSWGPYLWANGETKNSEGLSFTREDFARDGTHPSPQGQRKVGERLLRFFQTDATTKPWFVAR